jgi:hypothetical protein
MYGCGHVSVKLNSFSGQPETLSAHTAPVPRKVRQRKKSQTNAKSYGSAADLFYNGQAESSLTDTEEKRRRARG